MTIDIIPPQNTVHLTHPKYRPDIDGLWAIAVLSVVGFHAFPLWVHGGFIGVDLIAGNDSKAVKPADPAR